MGVCATVACGSEMSISSILAPDPYTAIYPLRYRTGWNGLYGVHAGGYTFGVNQNFYAQMRSAFYALSVYGNSYGMGHITWIGTNGIQGCKADSCHRNGTAMDVSAIQYQNGLIDMNVHWRYNNADRRRYLAVAVAVRRYTQYVQIYTDNDTAHQNHIHCDLNGATMSGPLSPSSSKDARLVQTLCNVFNNETLTVDGVWGSSTWDAYNRLLAVCGFSCRSPTTNWYHMLDFLRYIMQCGVGGRAAGYYAGVC